MRSKKLGISAINPLESGKTVVMTRHTTPTEGRMLDDAKHALAAQLAHFRRNANIEEWDVRKATAFQRLVQSLNTLQGSEKNALESFDVQSLTEEELTRLSSQSTRVLCGPPKPVSTDSQNTRLDDDSEVD